MRQIQFITHKNEHYGYADGVRMALHGGCKWIQLRMKGASDDEVKNVANEVQQLCRQNDALFVLDDRVELAKELEADGVHLGKNDMPVDEARRILGERFIIGGTANTYEDIERLYNQGVDYIGCGPFRFTTTKEKLAPVLGLEGYRNIMQQMRENGINLPVVAIGGITRTDIPDIMTTGINAIAVSGAILNAENPIEEMEKFINL